MSDSSSVSDADQPTESVAAAPQPAPAAPPARKSGWGGPVLGGVIAAGLGFGLAQYLPLASYLGVSTATIGQEDIAALKSEVADLRAALAALPSGDTAALSNRLTTVEGQIAALAPTDLTDITARLAALEQRPVGSLSGADAAALAALQTEVSAMKSAGISQTQVDAATAALQAKLDDALAAAEAMQSSATETAQKSAQRAALLQIGAALDSGAAFGSALQAFDTPLPDALTANAAGLASLKSLQDSFPQAARAALDAALKSDMGDGWTDRALSFLRTQVGARSLSPREGADPDAILSRAEAALIAGDVPAALTELDALPDIAKTAMADWRLAADQRQAAQSALATLTQELGL